MNTNDDDDDDDDDVVERLNAHLTRWRVDDGLVRVRPSSTFPDGTNRGGVAGGISIEHAHGIALDILKRGFDVDHDVPVVVRTRGEVLESDEGYGRWRAFARANEGVTPRANAEGGTGRAHATLGSSHFMLAMKLIEFDVGSVFGRGIRYGEAKQRDAGVREAIELGVPSVVLREETPARVRRYISVALNRSEDVGFKLCREMGVALRISRDRESVRELTVFEALSRTLDAEELSSLARIKYGLNLDDAESGYVAVSEMRSRL